MDSDYARKWLVTFISGVSEFNNYRTFFWGTTKEAASWAAAEVLADAGGDSPEYQGFSITYKGNPS